MQTEQALWRVTLTTRDHAGDTAAIASVFSGRGIQIDSFIGFGGNPAADGASAGCIVVTFHAFEDRAHTLCRVLQSLEAVVSVACEPAGTQDELATLAAAVKARLTRMR